jgi:hypothetical protein
MLSGMSRFIDRLKQASQSEPPPMGFKKEKAAARPRLLLVARLSQADADNIAGLAAGADAGLLAIGKSDLGIVKEVSKAAPDIPWGLFFSSAGGGQIKQAVEAGCDFVVFPPETPLGVLAVDKIGKIVAVESLLERELIRALDELPLDAVLIADKPAAAVTCYNLMLFKRFAGLSNKTLLAGVPPDITADELGLLWEAGVGGLVVEVSSGQAGVLAKLRQTIDALTPPSKRRRLRARAIVPPMRGETAPAIDEEEEEE